MHVKGQSRQPAQQAGSRGQCGWEGRAAQPG